MKSNYYYNYETPHWCHVFIHNHFPLKDDFRSRVFLLTLEWFLALFFFPFSDSLLFCWRIIPCEWSVQGCNTALFIHTLAHPPDNDRDPAFFHFISSSHRFLTLRLQVQPPTLPPYRPQFRNFFTSPCCSGARHAHLRNGPMQLLSVLPLVLRRHMLL